VRGFAAGSPARARRQAEVFEFHCGKPPPAAAPSTMTRNAGPPGYGSVQFRSDLGAGVRVDLQPDSDLDDARLLPLFHADLLSNIASAARK
jgi:hypothetical protein